jgi:xylan 1,4-beta-xylosidase
MRTLELSADAQGATRSLDHFWERVVGAGRAAEGLRADWQDHLRMVATSCGFQSVRFHGLFHDDMFVYRRGADRGVYNFQYVDTLFDAMLDAGVRPFVELGFSPRDLARDTETVFWWKGHGSPPVDLEAWAELVSNSVRHWVGRYGLDEVREWNFEVWNEPNLRPFFAGTRSEYFELYDVTARAVKSVDSELRVGGPATSNFVPDARFDGEVENLDQHELVRSASDLDLLDWRPVWLEAFLAFCQRRSLPVDFVSCHPYPTDWALDEHGTGCGRSRGVDATPRDLALLRQMVEASAFPDAEIHLTEWSSSSSPRDHAHDHLPVAAFVVRSVLHCLDTVSSLAYWTFTDVFEEAGAGDTPFHGGFGMITLQGVPKPSFHAYRLLHGLGDELLSWTPHGVLSRDARTGAISGLAFHYPPEVTSSVPASMGDRNQAAATLVSGQPALLSLELAGLPAGARVELELLDRDHGDAMTAWQRMGAPDDLSRDLVRELRRQADATLHTALVADSEGVVRWSGTLQPWSLLGIRQLVGEDS